MEKSEPILGRGVHASPAQWLSPGGTLRVRRRCDEVSPDLSAVSLRQSRVNVFGRRSKLSIICSGGDTGPGIVLSESRSHAAF
jgi:hypothetical protein